MPYLYSFFIIVNGIQGNKPPRINPATLPARGECIGHIKNRSLSTENKCLSYFLSVSRVFLFSFFVLYSHNKGTLVSIFLRTGLWHLLRRHVVSAALQSKLWKLNVEMNSILFFCCFFLFFIRLIETNIDTLSEASKKCGLWGLPWLEWITKIWINWWPCFLLFAFFTHVCIASIIFSCVMYMHGVSSAAAEEKALSELLFFFFSTSTLRMKTITIFKSKFMLMKASTDTLFWSVLAKISSATAWPVRIAQHD